MLCNHTHAKTDLPERRDFAITWSQVDMYSSLKTTPCPCNSTFYLPWAWAYCMCSWRVKFGEAVFMILWSQHKVACLIRYTQVKGCMAYPLWLYNDVFPALWLSASCSKPPAACKCPLPESLLVSAMPSMSCNCNSAPHPTLHIHQLLWLVPQPASRIGLVICNFLKPSNLEMKFSNSVWRYMRC